MNNASSQDHPDPYLALAWTQEVFGLWEAAFLCCGLEPPLNPPSELKDPPAVSRMAARIKDEVTACGRPNETRGERQRSERLQDEAYNRVSEFLRMAHEKPEAVDGQPEAHPPGEKTPAPEAAARYMVDLPPKIRFDIHTIANAIAKRIQERQRRDLKLKCRHKRPDSELYFNRWDLRAWMDEPLNANLRGLARFLYPPEPENRDTGELTDRERDKLLVVIGALVRQLAKTCPKLQHGKSPYIEQVFNRVCDEFMDEQGNILRGYGKSTIKDRMTRGLAALERLKQKNDKPQD